MVYVLSFTEQSVLFGFGLCAALPRRDMYRGQSQRRVNDRWSRVANSQYTSREMVNSVLDDLLDSWTRVSL